MNYKKWKIGFTVSIIFGLLTAGAGLAAGMTWQAFVAVLCTSLVTQLAAYLMKHPVEDISDDPPPFRPPLILLTGILALVLSLMACKTPRLEPGGAYAPTNSVGQVVYSDTGLMLTDASYKLAYETVSAVFKFERDNRITIWNLSPVVKGELDKLRPQVVDIDRRWAMARKTYKSNPTPAGLTAVQSILAEIQRIIPVVQQQMNPIYSKLTKTP